MRLIVIIFIFHSFFTFIKGVNAQGCEVDMSSAPRNDDDDAVRLPVLIRSGTNTFFRPVNGELRMRAGEKIELFCSGPWESPAGAPDLITIKCKSGTTFSYEANGRSFDIPFNRFACKEWPEFTYRRTSQSCFNRATIYEIGYEIGSRWLPVYASCFDARSERTWFTRHHLGRDANSFQHRVERPHPFENADFLPRNINAFYSQHVQRMTISKTLHDESAARRYVDPRENRYLSRGHMAAMTDFVLATEQRATCHFVNVAPQWQSFNNGNWRRIEEASREFAQLRGLSLDVWTGTAGVGTLKDGHGREFEIFLDKKDEGVPMPTFYYRILIDTASGNGVAFVGVNNPYVDENELRGSRYRICTDVSDQLQWGAKLEDWKVERTVIEEGFGYACTVGDFLKAIPHHSLHARDLLGRRSRKEQRLR